MDTTREIKEDHGKRILEYLALGVSGGVPVVAWLAHRGGKIEGMVATIEALHNQGLIQLDDEEEETQHGNN